MYKEAMTKDEGNYREYARRESRVEKKTSMGRLVTEGSKNSKMSENG